MIDEAMASWPRPPLIQFWDGEDVPDYVEELFDTFRERNPEFDHHVFSWTEADRFIETHFGSREAAAFRSCAVPAMQSDYFRYCAMLKLGGIYADADFECLAPLGPLLDRCSGGELFLGPGEFKLKLLSTHAMWNNFFVFPEPGHPFFRLVLDIATANIETRVAERIWPAGERVMHRVWLSTSGIPAVLCFMRDWGSFEALNEYAGGSGIGNFVGPYRAAVGEYERILQAFEGVRISPAEELFKWVNHPDHPLPYKETDVHWHNFKGPIFR